MSKLIQFFLFFTVVMTLGFPLSAQDHSGHNHSDHSGHNHSDHSGHNHADHAGNHSHDSDQHKSGANHSDDRHATDSHDAHGSHFDPAKTAFHHIADQNVYNIGPINIPLPCILYAPGKGWSIFSSSRFGIGAHGTGQNVVDGYILHEGMVRRLADNNMSAMSVDLGDNHPYKVKEVVVNGKTKEEVYAVYRRNEYKTLPKSTLDGGVLGGGITNFYDFSITKNVVSMILAALVLGWIFISMARAYGRRKGEAPRGLQSFMEPLFVFIQEEVSKPFIGPKWEKFQPLLMALFFFILFLNLFGQIPFLGGSNVTGNLSFTIVLAVIAFLVVNFNGNKHYWKHILWMPGVPAPVKLILTPVEVMGMFIKPLTLMLRLAANITAGHVIVVIFVGLIFIFKQQIGGAAGTGVGFAMAFPLTMFMFAIELIVAFIQAFVFTILTASYIGAAVEEEHH